MFTTRIHLPINFPFIVTTWKTTEKLPYPLGGTHFTSIINQPQAAILSLAKRTSKPVWNGVFFTPRQIPPFSVSYDHRIIDGAEAARFCTTLAACITDLKQTLL